MPAEGRGGQAEPTGSSARTREAAIIIDAGRVLKRPGAPLFRCCFGFAASHALDRTRIRGRRG